MVRELLRMLPLAIVAVVGTWLVVVYVLTAF